jgi:hypothetical protein
MPILLTATAKESKARAFQFVSYFEIVAPSRKTIHENTRSRTGCGVVGVFSWIVLSEWEKTKNQT